MMPKNHYALGHIPGGIMIMQENGHTFGDAEWSEMTDVWNFL
jgi:hypothetical protein